MKRIVKWLSDRYKEPSTVFGIIGIVTTTACFINPDQTSNYILAGGAAMSFYQIVRKEKKGEDVANEIASIRGNMGTSFTDTVTH